MPGTSRETHGCRKKKHLLARRWPRANRFWVFVLGPNCWRNPWEDEFSLIHIKKSAGIRCPSTRRVRRPFFFRMCHNHLFPFSGIATTSPSPKDCTRLADSEASENQAFVCNSRPVVGLQFHPEYTRDMVIYFARKNGHDWVPDVFISDKDKVIAQTKEIADTYWLMETLLNNMALEFAKYL